MRNGYTLAHRRKWTYLGCPRKGNFSDISCFGSLGLILKIMDRLGPLRPFRVEILDTTFDHNDPKRSIIYHNSLNSPKPEISFFRRPCICQLGHAKCEDVLDWGQSIAAFGRHRLEETSVKDGRVYGGAILNRTEKCKYQYFLHCIFIRIVKLWIVQNHCKLFCVSCYFQRANLHPLCEYITI